MSLWDKWRKWFQQRNNDDDDTKTEKRTPPERSARVTLEEARMTYQYARDVKRSTKKQVEMPSLREDPAPVIPVEQKRTLFQGKFTLSESASPIHGTQKDKIQYYRESGWQLTQTVQGDVNRRESFDDDMPYDDMETQDGSTPNEDLETHLSSEQDKGQAQLMSLQEEGAALVDEETSRAAKVKSDIAEDEPPLLHEEWEQSREDHVQQTGQQPSPVVEKQSSKQKKVVLPVNGETNTLKIPYNVLMLPEDRKPQKQGQYAAPPLHLLHTPPARTDDDPAETAAQATVLEETLASFHVDAKVVSSTKGPAVTRFDVQPAKGVKVNKVTNLIDDMKLALAAQDIRIEAPIPGKNAIGIEIPNRHAYPVMLREILRRDVFKRASSPLTVALGLDIAGQPVVTDLCEMPHGLVAGATGSGKSVCINSILISLLYKAAPDEVKLLLIDPKMVELSPYQDIPHLLAPVLTDPKQATTALKWVVQEMERRYEQFRNEGVRHIAGYNQKYTATKKTAMPYMIVVIDELADLMMVAPQDVEEAICRIAQKARACGIHLLLATQRPSVDVITGLIKANIPTRLAFAVASQMDSRTILDMGGAERLLGKGDMLFHENGQAKPVRVQGTFVSDEEISAVITYTKRYGKPQYMLDTSALAKSQASGQEEQEDPLFVEVADFVVAHGTASASSIQRRFRVGYNRAARLVDTLESRGIVSAAMGSKPRTVLVTEEELHEQLGEELAQRGHI